MEEDGHILLAAAIIKQAMTDYKNALREEDENEIRVCERFFLSEWGQLLSAHHGEYVIERCKKEVEMEEGVI